MEMYELFLKKWRILFSYIKFKILLKWLNTTRHLLAKFAEIQPELINLLVKLPQTNEFFSIRRCICSGLLHRPARYIWRSKEYSRDDHAGEGKRNNAAHCRCRQQVWPAGREKAGQKGNGWGLFLVKPVLLNVKFNGHFIVVTYNGLGRWFWLCGSFGKRKQKCCQHFFLLTLANAPERSTECGGNIFVQFNSSGLQGTLGNQSRQAAASFQSAHKRTLPSLARLPIWDAKPTRSNRGHLPKAKQLYAFIRIRTCESPTNNRLSIPLPVHSLLKSSSYGCYTALISHDLFLNMDQSNFHSYSYEHHKLFICHNGKLVLLNTNVEKKSFKNENY